MTSNIDLEINEKLKEAGLSRIALEDKKTLLIEFEQTPYRFTIYSTINETIKSIERRLKQFTTTKTIQIMMIFLQGKRISLSYI